LSFYAETVRTLYQELSWRVEIKRVDVCWSIASDKMQQQSILGTLGLSLRDHWSYFGVSILSWK